MTSRRIRALEALAERGATEGEREAARIALDKHRRKPVDRQPSPPRPEAYAYATNTDRRYTSDGDDTHNVFHWVWFKWYNDCGFDVPEPPRPTYRTRPPPPKPPPEPRVTQLRQAVAADFPDAPTAQGVDDSIALVEVVTMAEMWRLFNETEPWRVVWRGKVWTTRAVGTQYDRSRARFYVKILIKCLMPVHL